MIVIDASIAIKWFVTEGGREVALTVLDNIRTAPEEYAVPDLFYIEMTSVLSRILNNVQDIEQSILDLYDLGMIQVRLGSKLLRAAARISFQHDISGYDALYAATAKSLNGTWLTADIKAHSKIKSLGISKRLI